MAISCWDLPICRIVPGDSHGPCGPRNDVDIREYRKRHPDWGAFCYLAAGVIAAVAAQVSAAGVIAVAAAAAAEQNDQNDDPPNTVAAETVAVTHNRYLQNQDLSTWLIPSYSEGQKRCKEILWILLRQRFKEIVVHAFTYASI